MTGVTVQPSCTVLEAPVEVTVTVEVPVLPRLIEPGEIVPALTENCGEFGENLTTKASRQMPVQAAPPELDEVVLKPVRIAGKLVTVDEFSDCVSPVT